MYSTKLDIESIDAKPGYKLIVTNKNPNSRMQRKCKD